MVDTIKFSEFTNAGDLEPNQVTAGLNAGENVRFSNPFPLLAPGTTAERPTPSASMYYRLRFNTTLEAYEYYNPTLGDWVQLDDTSPSLTGPYVTYTTDPSLPNAFSLGSLSNGLLKQAVTMGISTPATAVLGTDYYGPAQPSPIPIVDGGTGASTAPAARTNLGLGTMAVQDANNVTITGGTASLASGQVAAVPVLGPDLVNKAYADSIAGGFTFKAACFAATTVDLDTTYNNGASGVGATLTANNNGVLTVDGENPALTQRVLVKDQTTLSDNGIYVVTDTGSVSDPFILERATDFDTAAEIVAGAIVFVTDGNTNADQSWVQTDPVTTVGTDPIIFIQFSQSYPLSMGNGGTGASLTATVNNLVYSTASNLALLATANNGVLVTSAGGVPSISSTLPSGLAIPGYAIDGANNDITSLIGLTGPIRAPTAIQSSASANLLTFDYTASAVNYLEITNAITGVSPILSAQGSDTDITLGLQSKGEGQIALVAHTPAPVVVLSGTGGQHQTNFVMADTAQNRTLEFPDADGIVALTSDIAMELLTVVTANNTSPLIAFTNLTGYSHYFFVLNNLKVATNGASIGFLTSADNGVSYLGSGFYLYQAFSALNTSLAGLSSTTTTYFPVTLSMTNIGFNGAYGTLLISDVSGTNRKGVVNDVSYWNTTPLNLNYKTIGQVGTTATINAVAFGTTAGFFQIGNIYMYGIR